MQWNNLNLRGLGGPLALLFRCLSDRKKKKVKKLPNLLDPSHKTKGKNEFQSTTLPRENTLLRQAACWNSHAIPCNLSHPQFDIFSFALVCQCSIIVRAWNCFRSLVCFFLFYGLTIFLISLLSIILSLLHVDFSEDIATLDTWRL